MSHPAAEMAYEEVLDRSADEQAVPRKKRSKGTSPTARTLAECRKRGWIAQNVEQFVRFPPPGHRLDLFGVIDIIAIVPDLRAPDRRCGAEGVDEDGNCMRCGLIPDCGLECPSGFFGLDVIRGAIVGIQATASAAHHAHRRTKILAEPRAKAWVDAGGRLELWSWSKRVARNKDGTKSARPAWTLRVETYEEMRVAAL